MTYEDKAAYCDRHHYSTVYLSYWQEHVKCEMPDCTNACEPPHHIVTRAAGGKDNRENLLGLCVLHHRHIHSIGVKTFARMYPQFYSKIWAALNAPKSVRK
jgi:hypothetical protein